MSDILKRADGSTGVGAIIGSGAGAEYDRDRMPTWTPTPPSEAGWYWVRLLPAEEDDFVEESLRVGHWDPRGEWLTVNGTDASFRGGDALWWPIPLEPPQ